MQTNITMVEFDATMWDAFAGAERGTGDEVPRSNEGSREVLLDGNLAIVLVDGNGVCVMEADSDAQWILSTQNFGLSLFVAERLGELAGTRVNIYASQLTALGFSQIA